MADLMNTDVLLDRLRQHIEGQDSAEVKRLIESLHPSVAAEVLACLAPFEMQLALELMEPRLRADVFGYFPSELQHTIAPQLSEKVLVDLINLLSHDERVDFLGDFEDDKKEHLIRKLAQKEREDVRKLDSYEDGTIGAIMTSDYVSLRPSIKASEALARLRQEAPDAETIYYAYVINEDRNIVGVVSLKQLILAHPDRVLEQFMKREVIALHTRDEAEEAVRQLHKSDLLALPVLDRQGKMVGIVTYDDVADVAEEESTEDFHRMGAVGDLGTMSLRTASFRQLLISRLPWLLVLVVMNIPSGWGISLFEETIAQVPSLVFFLPLLLGSGGNAGSQASTLMVRALSIGDVHINNWMALLRKEVGIALALGAAMGLAVALIASLRAPEVMAVVGLTMVGVVLAGSLIGMSLPFLLTKFKMDPATASAPLVTSLADVCGVIIYFSIATSFFPMATPS